MVKLTSELILESAFYTNALHERELDLRGQRIPEIENLGATRDAFDCIDLSGNDIAALANFPRLPRLTTLLLSGNRVTTIAADNIAASLPSLESLQLANNRVCVFSLSLNFHFLCQCFSLTCFTHSDGTQTDYRLCRGWTLGWSFVPGTPVACWKPDCDRQQLPPPRCASPSVPALPGRCQNHQARA